MSTVASDIVADDPITTEVIRHGLNSAAEQMKRAFVRTAFSPVIYEVLDFAVAIYDRRVRLLAQAIGMPHFMGRLGFGIEATVAAVGGEEALEPGDILFYNVSLPQRRARAERPSLDHWLGPARNR